MKADSKIANGAAARFIHLIANPYYYDFDAELELCVNLDGIKDSQRPHHLRKDDVQMNRITVDLQT